MNYNDRLVNVIGEDLSEFFSDYTLAAEAIYEKQFFYLKSILDRAGPKLVNRAGGRRNEDTLLHLAVRNKNYNMVHLLLKRGFDVNAQDNTHQTPLHHSLNIEADGRICQLLLDNGANVNLCDFAGRTPLHMRARCQTYLPDGEPCIKVLIERGSSLDARDFLVGYTALHYATDVGCTRDMRILLDEGANINARTRRRGSTPLHMAATKNWQWLTKFLLDHGADIEALNVDQATPLHLASQLGDEDCVRLLLERGANVNARNKYNNTPLLLAILGGSYRVVEIILKHRPDITDERVLSVSLGLLETAPNEARTSIHEALVGYGFTLHDCNPIDSLRVALMRGEYARAKLLIEQGVRPDQVQDSRELLIQAIENEREDVVELLIKGGVSFNAIGPCSEFSLQIYCLHWSGMVERNHSEGWVENPYIAMVIPLDKNGADRSRDWCLSKVKPLSCPIEGLSNDIQFKIIEVLLKHGADIDFPNHDNSTPLDIALARRNENLVRMLLINGADVNNGQPGRYNYEHPRIALINKLHIANSYLSDHNIHTLERSKRAIPIRDDFPAIPHVRYHRFESHPKQDEICRAEVSKMKEHKLLDGVSLHRIFITEDCGYLLNESLMDKLAQVNFDEFLEYGDLLRGKLKRDKKRNDELSRAREAFNLLILVRGIIRKDSCKRLLQELVIKIISQLSKFDQRQLTLCVEGLKKHLLTIRNG